MENEIEGKLDEIEKEIHDTESEMNSVLFRRFDGKPEIPLLSKKQMRIAEGRIQGLKFALKLFRPEHELFQVRETLPDACFDPSEEIPF